MGPSACASSLPPSHRRAIRCRSYSNANWIVEGRPTSRHPRRQGLRPLLRARKPASPWMGSLDDPQSARDAAVALVDTLLSEGVDPVGLRDVLRTQLAYNVLGSLAAPDAFAPYGVSVFPSGPAADAAATAAGTAAAAAPVAAPIPRLCANPACTRETDRGHKHCCRACRDHHWHGQPTVALVHEHRCGRYRSTPR